MPFALKAVLLSGLVLPGAGYFAVKRPLRGLLVCLPSIAAIVYLFSALFDIATALATQIETGVLAPDPGAIALAVTEASSGVVMARLGTSFWFLLALWIFSIVDGARIGARLDAERKAGN